MSDDEKQLQKNALEFVKKNKKLLFADLVGDRIFDDTSQRVAIFMAGTPGAGKTEVAQSLEPLFSVPPLRIDADEFRSRIPGYNGTNSHVIQSAASVAVDKILDQVYGSAIHLFLMEHLLSAKRSLI
jgi:UDP-N-acetylglucosamine kinase